MGRGEDCGKLESTWLASEKAGIQLQKMGAYRNAGTACPGVPVFVKFFHVLNIGPK